MDVDFFKDEEGIGSSHFGICDDVDVNAKTPAYVDCNLENESLWGANVVNSSGKSISFIAVDNRIEILRVDGSMENRCDAMLHNADYIIFVELKNQREDWIKHAVDDQLQTTIDVFKQNNDIMKYSRRFAYVCNKKHPLFQNSHKQQMQKFHSKNKVRLIICGNIMIK